MTCANRHDSVCHHTAVQPAQARWRRRGPVAAHGSPHAPELSKGLDGHWVLHPGQVDAANEIFSPRQEDYDHAENILDAYEWSTSEAGGMKGSAMLGDEMIDEASRKMALVISGKGRAAGMHRVDVWTPPSSDGAGGMSPYRLRP